MTFTEKIKQLYDDMDSSYGMPKWMNTLLDEMKFHNKALLKSNSSKHPFHPTQTFVLDALEDNMTVKFKLVHTLQHIANFHDVPMSWVMLIPHTVVDGVNNNFRVEIQSEYKIDKDIFVDDEGKSMILPYIAFLDGKDAGLIDENEEYLFELPDGFEDVVKKIKNMKPSLLLPLRKHDEADLFDDSAFAEEWA